MGVSNLSLIKPPKGKAKDAHTSLSIQEFLTHTYTDVKQRSTLKYVISFIQFVCCLVEEAYNKKSKINKKDEVFIQIAKFLSITLSDEDKAIIGEIIEDLHINKRIKKVTYLSKTSSLVKSLFLKKD